MKSNSADSHTQEPHTQVPLVPSSTDANTVAPIRGPEDLPHAHTPSENEAEEASFAETALKLGGKSEDEVRRMGAVDRADEQVERLFAAQYQTVSSPAHRAVWDRTFPTELFLSKPAEFPAAARKVMDDSLAVVRRHTQAGTVYDEHNKISDQVLSELGDAGYWGLLVDQQYGGSGTPFSAFTSFLTEMATVNPTIAGLASVHGCIGAVDPVSAFGTDEQKSRFLPKLASGESLSAFALTEPGAGSDLTALRTTARLEGDHYLLTGEKLFITNVRPGRTIGVVCLIDDKPAVLIVDLPKAENEHFQIKKYGLYALKHTYNQGLIFRDLPVPASNLLTPLKGDGLTIAYHGLNLGRVSLCANAAGTMRVMMASMLPWAEFRRTYGEPIARRELVRRRIGSLAGLIVGCDALVQWCSGLLEAGYRGEMECIIAKIFGSEAQKTAAIEFMMKTHGGRSFLHGHAFGDHVHEYLAPCIYEGEGEMLGMAFFKSLVKQHGRTYFEPIGMELAKLGVKAPNPLNPAHAWALRKPLMSYGSWYLGQKLLGKKQTELSRNLRPPHTEHATFAMKFLQKQALQISDLMRKHQLKLADRQCAMTELSLRVQHGIVILVTALYAGQHDEEIIRDAGAVLCDELRQQLTGKRPSSRYFKRVTSLGERIAAGGISSFTRAEAPEILMPYEN